MLPDVAPGAALAASFLLCAGGLAILARGGGRGARPARRALARPGAALALAASYAACVPALGVSVGLVVWLGLASLAMLLIVFLRPWAPWLPLLLARAGPIAGALVLLAGLAASAGPPA